jgi:hypothetical protein
MPLLSLVLLLPLTFGKEAAPVWRLARGNDKTAIPGPSASGWPDWPNYRLLGKFLPWCSYFENCKSFPNFRMLFSKSVKVMHQLWQNISWATFWAIFSQTHLVPLVGFVTPVGRLAACQQGDQGPMYYDF